MLHVKRDPSWKECQWWQGIGEPGQLATRPEDQKVTFDMIAKDDQSVPLLPVQLEYKTVTYVDKIFPIPNTCTIMGQCRDTQNVIKTTDPNIVKASVFARQDNRDGFNVLMNMLLKSKNEKADQNCLCGKVLPKNRVSIDQGPPIKFIIGLDDNDLPVVVFQHDN